MTAGQLDPWRSSTELDDERALELARLIELRGEAPEEVAARRAYLDLLGIGPGQRVLDVGCGTGVVTRSILARVTPGGSVVGVDAQPALLRVACEHTPGAEFRLGDASSLPFADSRFDVVVCATVLEHMPNAERAVPELVRVAKSGGRVGVLCGDQESFIVAHADRPLTRRILDAFVELRFANPWIGRDMPALLEHAGLRDVHVRAFPTLDRDPRRFAAHAARLRADIALQAGAVTNEEHTRWLAQLDARPDAFLAGATYIFTWGLRN
ncbi:MAG TPA: methyltransferase domain-containing protein [Chloroflexota bacterium]